MTNQKISRYPGIRSFTQDEQLIFCGRDDEIQKLYNLLRVHDVVVMHANSGIGKTSLLNAGLIPKLSEVLPIEVRFQDINISPIEKLRNTLSQYKNQELLGKYSNGKEFPWEIFKSRELTPFVENKIPLLIFDQFEEFFNHEKSDREEFIKEIECFIDGNLPDRVNEDLLNTNRNERTHEFMEWCTPVDVKILFVMRSDRFHLMDELSDEVPSIINNRFLLLPLTEAQAKEAIIKPTHKKGDEYRVRTFDYDNQLLNDMLSIQDSKGYIESWQLQLLCEAIEGRVELEQKEKDETIIATSEFLGGKEGIENIINDFYLSKIDELKSETEQIAAKNLFENKLISNGRRVRSDKNILLQEDGITRELLQSLIDKRLLKAETSDGFTSYEISHDTLIEPILKDKEKRLIIANRKLERTKRIQFGLIISGIIGLITLSFFLFKSIKTNQETKIESLKKESQYKLDIANKETLNSKLLQTAILVGNKDKTLQYAILKYTEDSTVYLNEDFNKSYNNYLINQSSFPGYKKTNYISDEDVISIAVSKGGRVLTGSRIIDDEKYDGYARLWENGIVKDSFNHKGSVYQVGFFKNSVITAGDYAVKFWRLNGQQEGSRNLDYKEGNAIRVLAVNKSQDKWAVGTSKGIIYTSIKKVGRLDNAEAKDEHNKKSITALAFLDSGGLVSAGSDKRILIHTDSSTFTLGNYPFISSSVTTLGDSLIAAGFYDGTLRIWKKIRGHYELTLAFKPHQERITDIAFSNDKNVKIATSSIDRTTLIWDLSGDKLKTLIGHKDQVNASSFDPSNSYKFYTVSNDNTMKEWFIKDYFEDEFLEHKDIVTTVLFKGEDLSFYSGSLDGQLYLNSTKDSEKTGIAIYDIERTKENDVLITGRTGIKIWNPTSTDKPKEIITSGRFYDIEDLGGGDFAACNSKGEILLYQNGNSQNFSSTNERKRNKIYSIDFCQEKNWLIGGGENGNLLFWNLKKDSLACLKGHDESIKTVAISKNGTLAVSGSLDNSIIIWKINSKQDTLFEASILKKIKRHSSDITKVEIYEEDSSYKILSASSDFSVRLWKVTKDLEYVGELKSMINHRSAIKDATFSKNGKYILTCGTDKKVKLWSISENEIDNYFNNYDRLENEVQNILKKVEVELENSKKEEN